MIAALPVLLVLFWLCTLLALALGWLLDWAVGRDEDGDRG